MSVETFSDGDGQPIYYIVYLQPSGFVIVPADDLVEPIVGFADDGKYEPSSNNPLGALVSRDLPGRIAGGSIITIIGHTVAWTTWPRRRSQRRVLSKAPLRYALLKTSRVNVKYSHNNWYIKRGQANSTTFQIGP